MTCYFKHLEPIFKKAGIEVTKENKKNVRTTIFTVIGANYPHCPEQWKEIKRRISEDETEFVSALRDAWSKAEKTK